MRAGGGRGGRERIGMGGIGLFGMYVRLGMCGADEGGWGRKMEECGGLGWIGVRRKGIGKIVDGMT